MKEIGGYFGIEIEEKKEYYTNLIRLNLGRNALAYLIQNKGIKKIYMPYYVCESVVYACRRENCEIEFYHITDKLMPILDKVPKENEFVYIINYFSQLSERIIKKLKEIYKQIILDNAHAFFQRPIEGINTIYTCRKFFGVPDGAYLATDIEKKYPQDNSMNRIIHLLGRHATTASDYFDCFKKCEKSFEKEAIKEMSHLTKTVLKSINYEKVAQKRMLNFRCLHNLLRNHNNLELNETEVPYGYPLYIENGSELRSRLIADKIYVPCLWPEILEMPSTSIEYKIANNMIVLPCDQRYGEEEMKFIVDRVMWHLSDIS